jgi:anti-sigma B factor antagonist
MGQDVPVDLTVDIVDEDGVPVVVVAGELDAHSAPVLDAALDQARAGRPTRVVVDMAGVSFIDSSGLRSLIRARRQHEDDPDSLVIRRPQPSTIRLLEITGMADHFSIE